MVRGRTEATPGVSGTNSYLAQTTSLCRARSLAQTARLTVIGDPEIQPFYNYVRIMIFTKDGAPYFMSGLYAIREVTQTITSERYNTKMTLFKYGSHDGSDLIADPKNPYTETDVSEIGSMPVPPTFTAPSEEESPKVKEAAKNSEAAPESVSHQVWTGVVAPPGSPIMDWGASLGEKLFGKRERENERG